MEIITLFKPKFNLDDPLDAASFACLTVCFWCVARVGKFTVTSINTFDPATHITRDRVSQVEDRNGLAVWKFALPVTKSSKASGRGESVQCTHQEGPADPITALKNHFCINAVAPEEHLFTWTHTSKKHRPLSKREFTNRINKPAELFNLPNLKGHSLCIGGTLEYLLQGGTLRRHPITRQMGQPPQFWSPSPSTPSLLSIKWYTLPAPSAPGKAASPITSLTPPSQGTAQPPLQASISGWKPFGFHPPPSYLHHPFVSTLAPSNQIAFSWPLISSVECLKA
ncbi:hypothetical protein ID866_11236 [Astraeus odoratus]|nr:hypothetical protein ID866_11236 [Astraeus odoratus]